jgi:hypothetical protein
MKRILLLALISLVCVMALAGCGGGSSGGLSGTPIFSTSGAGDSAYGGSSQITGTFQISGTCHIQTTCTAFNPANPLSLTVLVYPEGVPVDSTGTGNNYIGAVAQTKARTEIIAVEYSGSVYLAIIAFNIKDWSVNITQ